MENPKLEICKYCIRVLNIALYQNRVPLIYDISIINHDLDSADGYSLHITNDSNLFDEYDQPLSPIPAGKPVSVTDPILKINREKLIQLNESMTANIVVEIRNGNEIICSVTSPVKVLTYDQTMGSDYYDYLPSFVIPNHPVISSLVHDAAAQLKEWGKVPAIDDYQSGKPNRIRELAAAAFAAIQKKNIYYATVPAGYWDVGQRIRTPEVIMEQHLGNCMDMTLLYAALIEAMGLYPVLYLIEGHIFAGVWLTNQHFPDVCVFDSGELVKRLPQGTGELILVECTSMCVGQNRNFDDAEKKQDHENLEPEVFDVAVDVMAARLRKIRPIPARLGTIGNYQIEEDEPVYVSKAPTPLEIDISQTVELKAKKITSKRELWESKLLDLSQRNKLLNLPHNAKITPIMSCHVDELEDYLSDGEEFHLQPVPDWVTAVRCEVENIDTGSKSTISWINIQEIEKGSVYELSDWKVNGEIDFSEHFRQDYKNHRVYTYYTDKELEKNITAIYRDARSSQQENGVSSLYLAVGLLRWYAKSTSESPSYAPLVLVPIEIIRKSANQGFALHARDEEPHFNTTLLELLRQQYNIDITGLDPLPSDEHGVDIKKTFATVRNALFSLPKWDVVETCAIGNFSFAQFSMWNDLHRASDEFLSESKIVRSLTKGYIDWDVHKEEVCSDEKIYLPITVDDTQLDAIKMAAHGTTFVLHGPPGTGKSQTITAMIANLMALGKRVLFIAEKQVALEVVERRLAGLGLRDFCLEMHSEMANKKQILAQLEKAMSVKKIPTGNEFRDCASKTAASREKLDDYAEHLHMVQPCGYSLRGLIDLYETVSGMEKYLKFDWIEAGKLKKEQLQEHVNLIKQLAASGRSVDFSDKFLRQIGLEAYNADVRSNLQAAVRSYLESLHQICRGEELSEKLGLRKPESRSDFDNLHQTAVFFRSHKNIDDFFLQFLGSDKNAAETYYAGKSAVDKTEAGLLKKWNKEFLELDMGSFMNEHAACQKRFLGKQGAMNAFVNKLQKYAYIPLNYELLPSLFREISQYQESGKALQNEYARLSSDVKRIVDRYEDQESYENAYEEALRKKKIYSEFPGGLDALRACSEDATICALMNSYSDAYESLVKDEQQINSLLQRTTPVTVTRFVQEETEFCEYLMEHGGNLKECALYNTAKTECLENGLQPVVQAFEDGMDPDILIPAYKKGLYFALINNIISSDDVLCSFSGATFNEAVQQFKRMDSQLQEKTKTEIYNLLCSRVPSAYDSPEIGMQLSLLRKAIGSKARGMSIRNLFERMTEVIQRLCPCMLMSPDLVSQYFAYDSGLFDVVIFDEASQLPTCKAIGALSRAKNAVIVGDPKQMPPTSFFSGSGPEVDDLALDDLDSILDDALALGVPSQYLQWHYRSTHESLIAFSNSEFYENKMYTFPSANDRERHVTAVYVENAYHVKDVNQKEAEAVVSEILRRYREPQLKKQTVGVVTFNIKQRDLILNLLSKEYEKDSGFDAWANPKDSENKPIEDETLFVKNLENVQGDERDIILFSIGFGKADESHQVSLNFGPINKEGGGKRLNVAFSRSKVEMMIFMSFHVSEIEGRVTKSSPEGLQAFLHFLKFAEGQKLKKAEDASAEELTAVPGIMQSICDFLRENGYQCEAQVGHSSFRLDIAVIDPYEPTEYLLGIMLDGENYRKTKNTRDREVAQLGVLNRLGWKLHRIWTVDWWDNKDRELGLLLDKLEDLKHQSEERMKAKKAEEEAKPAEEKEVAAPKAVESPAVQEDSQISIFDIEVSAPGTVENETAELKEKVQDVTGPEDTYTEEKVEPEEKGAEATESVDDKPDLGDLLEYENESAIPSKNTITEAVEYCLEPYQSVSLPVTYMSPDEFSAPSNKAEVAKRILEIAETEAPILKSTLCVEVFNTFGVNKSAATMEAFEKALKAAKIKSTKQKGSVFCWAPEQDPKSYTGIRVTNERLSGELCQQEIRNAICYVLKKNGDMNRDALIKEVSLVFGYKRLGKNLEAVLLLGLQFAKSNGDITIAKDGNCSLNK